MEIIKRFFQNKNIVTVIAAVVCVIIIFFAYKYRVSQAINTTTVPQAAVKIEARTEITKDLIKSTKVATSLISDNVIKDQNEIIGKFVNYNTVIPKGSLFYKGSVVEWEKMPDSAWSNISSGNTIVSLAVNQTTTYGNSIYPGDYIDLYYKTYDNKGKLVYGPLIKSIKVLAVKDVNGEHIFKKSADQQDASALIFQVTEEYHLILRVAMSIGGSQIIPVPRNANYGKDEVTTLSSEYIVKFIQDKSQMLEPDIIEEPDNSDINITE